MTLAFIRFTQILIQKLQPWKEKKQVMVESSRTYEIQEQIHTY